MSTSFLKVACLRACCTAPPMRLLLVLLAASTLVPAHTWQRRSFSLDTSFLDEALSRRSELSRRQSWTLTQPGTTGVGAMQLAVVSPTQVLLLDRVEHNALTINGHIAWSAIYSLTTNTVRPVDLVTDSFCAGGSWISNGTLVSVGGNAVENPVAGDANGFQGIRLFNPADCPDSASQCALYESPRRIRLTSTRWRVHRILRGRNGC